MSLRGKSLIRMRLTAPAALLLIAAAVSTASTDGATSTESSDVEAAGSRKQPTSHFSLHCAPLIILHLVLNVQC